MSETDGFSNEISDNAFHSLLKSFFDTDSVRSNEQHIFLKFKSKTHIYLLNKQHVKVSNSDKVIFLCAWFHGDYDRSFYISQKRFGGVLCVLTFLCIAKRSFSILHDKYITAERNKFFFVLNTDN